MKIAIISVSDKGEKLAKILKSKLDDDSTIIRTDLFHKDVKNTFPILFYEYDAVIAIMASGILIRSIAPLIDSKVSDPAVVNIDDNGKFVISTLSGHLGGANDLTRKIANILDAVEVITTSTDVNKKLGIDVLARDLYLSIDDTSEILFFNKAILEGREITLEVNPNHDFDYLFTYLNDNTLEINVSIIFTSKINTDEIHVTLDEHEMTLHERKVVVGVGCKRGKACSEIYDALKKVASDLNIPISRVNLIASAWIKSDEAGILELSDKLAIKTIFVEKDKLEMFTSPDTTKSDFVKSKIGVEGVCEQSSLIVAGFNSKLIYKKTSFDGITIAVSVSE